MLIPLLWPFNLLLLSTMPTDNTVAAWVHLWSVLTLHWKTLHRHEWTHCFTWVHVWCRVPSLQILAFMLVEFLDVYLCDLECGNRLALCDFYSHKRLCVFVCLFGIRYHLASALWELCRKQVIILIMLPTTEVLLVKLLFQLPSLASLSALI